MEIYIAYAILLALWLLVVTPLIGCVFETYSIDYMDYLVCGLKVQIFIIAPCALIGVVVWAFDTVAQHLR